MASKECDIRQTGNIQLEGGQLVLYDRRGDRVGHMLMGGREGNILFIDGVEVTLSQKNDPPKLRLASRYDDGLRGGGLVTFNRLRAGEDVQEELVQWSGTQEDYPQGDDAGMFRILVRGQQGPDDMPVALVATAEFSEERFGVRQLWVGLRNYIDGLWKYE